jgi:hypothetical protein
MKMITALGCSLLSQRQSGHVLKQTVRLHPLIRRWEYHSKQTLEGRRCLSLFLHARLFVAMNMTRPVADALAKGLVKICQWLQRLRYFAQSTQPLV